MDDRVSSASIAQLFDRLTSVRRLRERSGVTVQNNRSAVTLLAVCEFGRRLHENGSRGTDHGSASVALLFGEQLPNRLIGRYPNLSPPELC